MIHIKRIYDPYEKTDGFRILVDRLWPRGMRKENAHIDLWLKEVAPSSELRTWFGHELDRWAEFKRRYKRELRGNLAFDELKSVARKHKVVTLLFAAKDTQHNEAVILAELL